MKKIIIIVLAFALAINANSQSNITDGSLDSWKQLSGQGKSFFEPQNDYLQSLNRLAIEIPLTFVLDVPITSERSTDSYSGAFAAKLTSKNATSPGGPIFLPGALSNIGAFLIAQQTVRLGRPYNLAEKPQFFNGYFKYEPVNGDSALALVLISKWNASSKKRDTIALGKNIIKQAIGTYTLISTPINYFSETTPDSLTILVCSSAGLNFSNLQASVGQVGSTLYVDELNFDFTVSINELGIETPHYKIFPNPAQDFLNIQSDKILNNQTLKIYDLAGKIIYQSQLQDYNTSIDLAKLKKGLYIIQIEELAKIVYTEKIIIE
jgi:hypothetical protein